MNVFVTGATGVLGRATVPVLIAAGHTVRGMATSPEHDERLRALGALPVRADLVAPASLRSAVAGCDAVLHLASKIPAPPAAQDIQSWQENDWIRRVGTRHLVDAALAADVDTVVYPSVVFVYPDRGDAWVDARTPVDPPRTLLSDLDAEREVARFSGAGRRGVVLRLGRLYGADSPSTVALLRSARQGIAPVTGRGDAYESWICAVDAATAFLAAIEGVPAGVYDLVDDEPLRRDQEAEVLAWAVGRRQLTRPKPAALDQPLGALDEAIGRSVRVSNRLFKEASGWTPRYPSLRQGLAAIVAAARSPAIPTDVVAASTASVH
ncbi:MAG TPA: NAD-dependent epimerase/dehydratase family protein [Thermomicrobiales bacterium]